MLFPISINLTELLERFGQQSVSIVCSAIEQELRDQGEVVRLVVLDARGQLIMDSSHTRSKLVYSVIHSSFCDPMKFLFFGKRNRRHFRTTCLQWISQFQAPLPPKFFKHSSAGYVSSQSGMCTQERVFVLLNFIFCISFEKRNIYGIVEKYMQRCLVLNFWFYYIFFTFMASFIYDTGLPWSFFLENIVF